MKINCLAFVLPSLLLFACSAAPERVTPKSKANSASGNPTASGIIQDEAAKKLYLGDMAESTDEEIPSETPIDPSVENDKKAARLQAMAKDLILALDADQSASLSQEEFLSLLAKKKISVKRKAKVEAKLTAEFEKFDNAEGELDEAALIELLKAQGDRIGKFRTKKHKGKQAERLQETVQKILAEFDKNGDKVLDQSELEAFLAARLGIEPEAEIPDTGDGSAEEGGKGEEGGGEEEGNGEEEGDGGEEEGGKGGEEEGDGGEEEGDGGEEEGDGGEEEGDGGEEEGGKGGDCEKGQKGKNCKKHNDDCDDQDDPAQSSKK